MSGEAVDLIAKGPCAACGSSDACASYTDGHSYCFSCGRHDAGTGGNPARSPRAAGLIDGEHRPLPPRALSVETCRKFGIRVGRMKDQPVVTMDYRDQDGTVVAQKVRLPGKDFMVLGDLKKALPLFGQHLWPGGGRKVVVTEGEFDAAALCQAQDLRWPVVSVPNGADGAKKSLGKALTWLEGFDEVILAFDADDAGRAAVAACGPLFPPGKLRVATFIGFKDANEAVITGQERTLLKAIWDAAPWRPDGIVGLADIRAKVLTPATQGVPYAWPGITEATYGRMPGQLIGLGAGTGIGKTDWFTQQIEFDVMTLGLKVGVVYMEQDTGETGQRLAGKVARRTFHVPDGSWTPEELEAAWNALEATGRVLFYDNFGAMDWDTVKGQLRFMVNEGCQVLYVDHLTALAAAADDERIALERIMSELAGLAKSTGTIIHFISHLTTPEKGDPHEEGGRVTIRQFKGSRAIGFWAHMMFGLERDCQADDESERMVSTLRCLKDRRTGRANGKTWRLRYDLGTGFLSEDAGAVPGSPNPTDLF